jgi:long-chain acyl-CoA synthetase
MLKTYTLEWLVADLALAAYCIPTISVASPDLIDDVLEAHPPNAILVQATFLDQLLEVLHEKSHAPVVIVVGDRTGHVAKWSSKVDVKLMSWEQVANTSSDFPLLMPSQPIFFAKYLY